MLIVWLLLGVLATLIFVWVYGFLRLNDRSLPIADTSIYKRALVIFPHPDDEVLTAGGLIGKLRAQGAAVKVVFLTLGERGTPDGKIDLELKQKRILEAHSVAKTFGITDLVLEDFGDGVLEQKTSELALYVQNLLASYKPELVVTYDQSGLYGHPDHIAVSEVVSEIIRSHAQPPELWYPSYPRSVLEMIALPEHMANNAAFKAKRRLPTHRVPAPGAFWQKAKAIRQYATQTASFQKSLPVPWLPLEYVYSLTPWEYFAVVSERNR
jgi:N-acetylglucosamine malate deacetylase 2